MFSHIPLRSLTGYTLLPLAPTAIECEMAGR